MTSQNIQEKQEYVIHKCYYNLTNTWSKFSQVTEILLTDRVLTHTGTHLTAQIASRVLLEGVLACCGQGRRRRRHREE
jgi:hypothetical protein